MIFGEYAKKYYEKGILVIPLHAEGKKRKAPFFDDWTQWNYKELTPETMDQWVRRFPNNNIGLICGEKSNIIGVDVDTEDPVILALFEKFLPKSPWRRIGRKGYMQAYKFNSKVHGGKTFQIKDQNGAMIVECLQIGRQFVLPPSIHPDTERPYTSNCNLYDVLNDLIQLPDDFEERLREALSTIVPLQNKGAFRSNNHVSVGSRDNEMTRAAGSFARGVMRGECSLKRALSDMHGWVATRVEQVAGDPTDPEKGKRQVIQFVLRDVHQRNIILPTGWDEELTDQDKIDLGLNFTEDQKEWTFDQIHAYVKGEFEAPEGGPARRFTAIQLMLKKMSISPNLSIVDKKRLMKYFSSNTPEKIAIGTFEQQLKEMQRGGIAGANHTEIAEETIKEFEERVGQLAYVNESFMTWGGSHWKEVEDREIIKLIANDFGALDAAKRHSDHSGILKTIAALVPQKLSITRAVGVNFANGFLTSDMRLIEHAPQFGMTYTLPYRYLPEQAGKCPRFLKMMQDFWGNESDYAERLHALKEIISATIMGQATAYQQAILLKGKGGSGKSQLLDIIMTMLPQEAQCALPPHEWHEKFRFASMNGKLLNVCGELPEKALIDGAAFKGVVVGDQRTGEHKNKDPFEFRPIAAHWFSSNYFPKTRDTTHGFNRRWAILTFNNIVAEEDKIKDLGRGIAEDEIEEIVAWALTAYKGMHNRAEYDLPPSHFTALNDLELQNSSVRQWLEECVTIEEGAKVTLEDAHRAYWSFSLLASSPVQKQRFKQEVEDYCNEKVGKGALQITFERGDKGALTFHNMRVHKPRAAG